MAKNVDKCKPRATDSLRGLSPRAQLTSSLHLGELLSERCRTDDLSPDVPILGFFSRQCK